MTETFTIAHLTDIHLSPVAGFTPRYWNAKRMLGFLNWHVKRRGVHRRDVADALIADAKALRADHIVITGDLINLGLPREYEAALDWLKSVGSPDRVTVIPGNHDIYSRLHGDAGVARWAAYMGGEADTLAFPFVRRFGPVALIGLNSAIETPPFVAAGRLGPDQIEVTRDLLERLGDDDAIRVVLIHHPPLDGLASTRRGLKDVKPFQNMLEKNGADLVLYGHNHRPQLTWLETMTGPLAVIGGASASAAKRHNAEPLAQYNLFTFFKSTQGVRVRQVVRGLETSYGPVVKLSEHVLEVGA
ncbi:MAG: metallophosphoesterase [Hyphomicrobium sp.]